MTDALIGFGVGVVFALLFIVPAIGFTALQLRKAKRNRRRRARSQTRLPHPPSMAERDNPGESPSVGSLGSASSLPLGQTRPQASSRTHGRDRGETR